jgi:hypothetical protein
MAGLAGGQGNEVATSPAETGRDDEAADGAFPPSVQGFSSAEFGLSEAVANS